MLGREDLKEWLGGGHRGVDSAREPRPSTVRETANRDPPLVVDETTRVQCVRAAVGGMTLKCARLAVVNRS
jgi:hypothetical protein